MDRIGLPRKSENPASVDLTLARPTDAGRGGHDPQRDDRPDAATGTQYALDADVGFGSTDLTKTVSATCTEAGPDRERPGGRDHAVGVPRRSDATIAVTNQTQAAGGANAETDPAYLGRALGFLRTTIRRGVLGAIEFGATEVAGVTVAKAIEVVNPGNSLPAGAVQLVVSDDNGFSSGAIIQAVVDSLLSFRTAGIPVFVVGGSVVYQAVRWVGLEYAVGSDELQSQADIAAVTVAAAQFLAPSQTLRRSLLTAAAKTVPGVDVPDGALVNPPGDVFTTAPQQIIRIRPQDVTFG